jgi:hypothetical protein
MVDRVEKGHVGIVHIDVGAALYGDEVSHDQEQYNFIF